MLKQRLIALGAGAVLALAGAHIGLREGVSYVPYADIGGVPTWCYGQTVGHAKARYTAAECDLDLLRMTREYHASVMQYVPEDAPASLQAAFTDLAVNVGKYGWQWEYVQGRKVPSRFMQPLADGDWSAACAALTAPWQGKHGVSQGFKATVKGKPVRGLENRRGDGRKLCEVDL
jgi:lysozyme